MPALPSLGQYHCVVLLSSFNTLLPPVLSREDVLRSVECHIYFPVDLFLPAPNPSPPALTIRVPSPLDLCEGVVIAIVAW